MDDEIYLEGLVKEFESWDHFFRTAIGNPFHYFHEYLSKRLDANLSLQRLPASMLDPNGVEFSILDVGSGPLPFLGRQYNGKSIRMFAVDALANEYRELYGRYGVVPPTIPRQGLAENLEVMYPKMFDLVYARNSLDHTQNPVLCIQQMIGVSKKSVLLEHKVNEGKVERYNGLHQWNFFLRDGLFHVADRNGHEICLNEKLKVKSIQSSVMNEEEENIPDWLIVKIEI